MMWDIALMKFCLITKQTSLSWSVELNKPHIFMLSALTKARIWTKKPPNPLEVSLASAASKGNFPFSPSVPLLWACIWLFSLPQTQSSRFPVAFLHFVRPQGNHVDHGALPCASPLSRTCCAFSSLIPQGHLFIFFCVCVFSWRKNSGSPPISMKFHKRDFPFSPEIWMVPSFWGCITLFWALFWKMPFLPCEPRTASAHFVLGFISSCQNGHFEQ